MSIEIGAISLAAAVGPLEAGAKQNKAKAEEWASMAGRFRALRSYMVRELDGFGPTAEAASNIMGGLLTGAEVACARRARKKAEEAERMEGVARHLRVAIASVPLNPQGREIAELILGETREETFNRGAAESLREAMRIRPALPPWFSAGKRVEAWTPGGWKPALVVSVPWWCDEFESWRAKVEIEGEILALGAEDAREERQNEH